MEQLLVYSLVLTALRLGVPLLLAALGELIGERAGVLNIGLEGMMLCGAWAGAASSFATHNAALGLCGAMAAGALLAALFALLTLTFKADPIITGTGLNLFALGFTGVAHRAMSTRFNDYRAVRLPEEFFFVACALLVPLLWWGFGRTRLGLQVRAVGEYPAAADAAGVNPNRVRFASTLVNGALCGAAGAYLSLSHTDSFAENMTAGKGFIALAIVIFGRWNPFGALGAALLFAAAEGSQLWLQSTFGTLFLPFLQALPYILTLVTLAGFSTSRKNTKHKSRARLGASALADASPPAALAQPYDK